MNIPKLVGDLIKECRPVAPFIIGAMMIGALLVAGIVLIIQSFTEGFTP